MFICAGDVYFTHGLIPKSVSRLLVERLTNIVGYELIAAILAVIIADSLFPCNVGIRHFIDSKPALGCILKGSSPQVDLNWLSGYVWFAAGSRMRTYWGQYVPSKANLADAPSRGDLSIMKQLGVTCLPCDFNCFKGAAEWFDSLQSELLVQ